MKTILFVCSGNTCRSPMAEGLLKAVLENDESLSREFAADSAGISAYDGDSASMGAIKALRSGWDIDISGHSAKTLTGEIAGDSFLILAMTRNHKDYISEMYPDVRQKLYTLKEYSAKVCKDSETGPEKGLSGCMIPGFEEYDYSLDICDPYGMSQIAYDRCAAEIKKAVDSLVIKLKGIDGSNRPQV